MSMDIITSRQNKAIAEMKKLGAKAAFRREKGEYLCDGIKLLKEALLWKAEISLILAGEDTVLPPEAEGVRTLRCTRDILEYVSPVQTTDGIIFSVKMKTQIKDAPGRTLVLDSLQDPGNVGTILRTANALGMDTVILTGDICDIYNPKTVRAAMGALFRQRFLLMSYDELGAFSEETGLTLIAAALSPEAKDLREVSLEGKAVVIGNEGKGVSEKMLSLCRGELIIPMNSACESLNAAIAAAIIMWEAMK